MLKSFIVSQVLFPLIKTHHLSQTTGLSDADVYKKD